MGGLKEMFSQMQSELMPTRSSFVLFSRHFYPHAFVTRQQLHQRHGSKALQRSTSAHEQADPRSVRFTRKHKYKGVLSNVLPGTPR